ncbi:serine hydrolase [Candidatus Bathyarchaeota archaeon]|nr:serine hydrolase [Candidatus Bathyarchaeota archaeon]
MGSGIRLLSSWIESQMAYRGQPGLSIAVVHDQDVVWARGFGYADVESGRPASPDTLYRIASITKLFTATSVMILRDRGKLSIYDEVADHLDWFRVKQRGRPVRIWHLLTHTSGLPRESPYPYWTDMEFPTREQMIEALQAQETVIPVENKWKYSNLALSVAGEVVQKVSGTPYPEFVRRNILEPLGMSDTYVESPDPGHPRLAKGYTRRLPDMTREVAEYTDSRGITPAANMTTTVLDLAKFAMLQFRDGEAGGAQILSGETLREMHQVHWLDPGWELGWGIGFNVQRIGGRTYIGHGGSVRGYRTNLRIDLDAKVVFVVFTNADDGEPVLYVDKACQWVAPAIREATRPEPEKPEIEYSPYVGKYRSGWGDTEVIVLNGELHMISPNLLDPMLTPIKLIPVSEHTFRMEAAGYGSHGELAVFEFDDEGQVTRLKTGPNYSERIERW